MTCSKVTIFWRADVRPTSSEADISEKANPFLRTSPRLRVGAAGAGPSQGCGTCLQPLIQPPRTNQSYSSANSGESSIWGTSWKITYSRAKSICSKVPSFPFCTGKFCIMEVSISEELERQNESTFLQKNKNNLKKLQFLQQLCHAT